jgi:phenylalanyl-tRNA synthetase beta chain
VTAGKIEDCLKTVKSDILKAFQLFDVYSGDGVEVGKKSLAVAFQLQHTERTLTDEEVDSVINTLTDALSTQVGAVVRT